MSVIEGSELGGCDDDITSPTMPEIAGEHQATRIELAGDGGGTRNLVSEGANLRLTLDQDGSVPGIWSVPSGVLPSGEAEERGLSGSWTLSGETVQFQVPNGFFLETIDLRTVWT